MLRKLFSNKSNVFSKILMKWLFMEGIFLRFDMKHKSVDVWAGWYH